MSKLPIVEGIAKYMKEKNIPFSMPGHKAGRGFLATEEGKQLYENLINGDITEVEGLDNFHRSEGIIKEAQVLLSKLYGSDKSYFLVNGSTSGNLAMIFSCFKEGDKIIVERNCHRSVFNAIIMRKLTPVFIKDIISDKFNAPFSIDMEHFLQLIEQHGDAKGIVVTYPNYYGICMDLTTVIMEAKKRNMLVLVDSAHGAHFGFNEMLPRSALELGANMVVMSAHKTLPSLTQSAYLHAGKNINLSLLDFYVSAFSSTSPSYMLLSTLDYARFYMENYGYLAYKKCLNLAKKYREKINEIDGFHIISRDDLSNESSYKGMDIDESRYVINMNKEYNAYTLLNYLRSKGIQGEMSDHSNIVLILSPFNLEEDFEKLYKVLLKCPKEKVKEKYTKIWFNKIPYSALLPYEVMNKKQTKVKHYDAKGRISAVNIVPYPPGVPIIMLGEIVDEEAIDMIQYYLNNGVSILGLEDGYISVVDDEDLDN